MALFVSGKDCLYLHVIEKQFQIVNAVPSLPPDPLHVKRSLALKVYSVIKWFCYVIVFPLTSIIELAISPLFLLIG